MVFLPYTKYMTFIKEFTDGTTFTYNTINYFVMFHFSSKFKTNKVMVKNKACKVEQHIIQY